MRDSAARSDLRTDRHTVAVFRPDDERIDEAATLLETLGTEPVPDPMLAVEPTGTVPRTDADYAILTSKTGAELVAEGGWDPGNATVCAIGPATADALGEAGYAVDVVPDEYTSSGLVDALATRRANDVAEGDDVGDASTSDASIDGARVEIARSDHGSQVLLDGLEDAGAYLHETILYRLVRPEGSGRSTELAASGELDAACFTSSLTVEHFLEAAAERGRRDEVLAALDGTTVVGAIGPPTRETLADRGIEADLVASEATFEALARETVDAI